ncbi:MAG: zinc/manganese transport system permease protein [Pseudonocardiales bacterium]|jgi:zinc/manganese transport system permease protein|nr:zinc/manganese transport system permease protein [Pseudonocardiales bacterium]
MTPAPIPPSSKLGGGRILASDPITGISHMLGHPFIQHALLAGTAIALLSGLVGYFVVLRGQVFAGDALSHVAYAGALAALAAGVDLRFGLFAATIVVGLALGVLGGRGAADDVVIGTTFAWVLGLGVFFLALYTTHGSTSNGAANVNVLFGSIFGISASAATLAAWIAAGLIAVVLLIARPLLFASLDPAVASARGVPVRLLGPLFLAVVGATAAEASQAVGALLLVGLLAAPAGAAQRLTDRPWTGLALSAALAVAAMWGGLALAYAAPKLPASFAIMALATLEFALAALASIALRRRVRRQQRLSMPRDGDPRPTASPAQFARHA